MIINSVTHVFRRVGLLKTNTVYGWWTSRVTTLPPVGLTSRIGFRSCSNQQHSALSLPVPLHSMHTSRQCRPCRRCAHRCRLLHSFFQLQPIDPLSVLLALLACQSVLVNITDPQCASISSTMSSSLELISQSDPALHRSSLCI